MENRSLVTIAEHSKEKILYMLEMAKWSWKRVESWASIGAIGFIPSASVKDWGWVEDRGLLSARDRKSVV